VEDDRERDHPHRLLCVVRTVRERDPGPGTELAQPKPARRDTGVQPLEDPVEEQQQQERRRERDRRREDRGNDDLVREAVPLHARGTRLHERGADEAADQGVRRARR